MTTRRRRLIEPVLLGLALAAAIVVLARMQAADVIWPVFVVPFQGAALISGNGQEPPAWLFHLVLFLQCYLVVLALGWLVGRYRGRTVRAG
jgi:hypothetical protein